MTVSRFGVLRAVIMSTLLLSILGITMGVHQYCSVYREIQPCSCKMENSKISINCEKMQSFGDVIALLQNKFLLKDRIILRIAYSNLDDMSLRSFKELNMTIEDLKLNHDDLSEITAYTFAGLTNVSYLSLADNPIPYMPIEVFEMMPNIKTLDIGRLRLRNIPEESFRSLPLLDTLVLPANLLYRMDIHAIPPSVTKLHLARNSIRDLNGTLRHLTELQWLFINGNELITLDNQLPKNGLKIKMLHAANNRIESLPQEIKSFPNLDILFFQHNMIRSLDGALSKSRRLERANLENNRISILLPDDFAETENLQVLDLQHNHITNLNNSMLPLRKLRVLNLTDNNLSEFSWQEIRGLQDLRILDLSFNKINHLTGLMPNLIEWETKLTYLKLDHNELYSLNGALSGLRSLLRLNLSFNSLTRISPDDLIGLDQLTMLDVSHNELTTLEETSKTFLPALEELIASHNKLTVLDKDFHGLPVLCWADLSSNHIVALGRDLVSKTHCKVHDGVHEDNWGTLKIYLKDNPILCDAALPEINSAMEVNHTRIVGVSHCPPLSEQPVTNKPNAFLGYIPFSTPQTVAQNPNIYNVDTNHLRETIRQDGNQLQDLSFPQHKVRSEQFVPIEDNHQVLRHNHGIQYHPAHPQTQLSYQPTNNFQNNEPLQLRIPHPHLPVNNENTLITNNAYKVENEGQVNIANTNLTPLEENESLSKSNSFKRSNDHHVQTVLGVTEIPLGDQPIYTHIDPLVQEQQISQLASEIEQLRSRVQELTSENQRLAQNLHSILPVLNNTNVFENHKQILPLEQLIVLTSEKTPNQDDSRKP